MIWIKSRYTGEVIFSADISSVKDAVEEAARERANLSRAYLGGANLSGANLGDADLSRAYLGGANLSGANLSRANLGRANLGDADLSRAYLGDAYLGGADLGGANLSGANLGGANLSGANLSRADLNGAKITDSLVLQQNGVFQITPIGSRNATLVAFNTDKGIFVKTGCFFGTADEFSAACDKTHGATKYAKEYAAAVELIKIHFGEVCR